MGWRAYGRSSYNRRNHSRREVHTQDSWRGVRPVIHYSVSREEHLNDHPGHISPDLRTLLDSGHKKAKLRAHSNFYWNTAVNQWALSFRDNFDMMCESKAKNLASFALYEEAKGITLPVACDRELVLLS